MKYLTIILWNRGEYSALFTEPETEENTCFSIYTPWSDLNSFKRKSLKFDLFHSLVHAWKGAWNGNTGAKVKTVDIYRIFKHGKSLNKFWSQTSTNSDLKRIRQKSKSIVFWRNHFDCLTKVFAKIIDEIWDSRRPKTLCHARAMDFGRSLLDFKLASHLWPETTKIW